MNIAPGDAVDQIRALAEPFDGVVGVAARDFGSDARIEYNADTIFPTASTFKTVLLYELYRQVDQGIIDPAMRITFEDRQRVPGSGVLQDLDAGAVLTVKDIATLMIVVSDNAGTDIIYDLIGRGPVADTLKRLGMTQTHLPLGCWEILAGLQNLDPADPSLTYEELKRRLEASESPWESNALKETPDNDISTPNDFLILLEKIYRGEGLSASSRDAVIDILKRQKFAERIPALLPFGVQVAHKTGSVKGVRNDVGIVYAGDTTYGIALMSKRAENGAAAVELLAKLSKVVYDAFVGEDGGAA
ncbi:MAG TPA: serine hydrolase [Nitrolancea sp.]|nr:serine hydrolase [Nitrolancea sp.]